MNIVVFVGSRANLGRLESLIKELKNHLEFKVYVIGACTLDQVDHDIDLDYYIHADMYRDIYGNRAKSSSMITMSMIDWLGYYKMDMAICHGDRFETLGFAKLVTIAKYHSCIWKREICHILIMIQDGQSHLYQVFTWLLHLQVMHGLKIKKYLIHIMLEVQLLIIF
jgi:UDP-N-acetylglucosamine 2-epimerase